MKKKIIYNILGEIWTISLLTEDTFFSRNEELDRAVTDTEDRTIEFVETDFNIFLVTHELTHAYLTYQLNFFVSDEDHQEENVCDLTGKYAISIVEDAKAIYKLLGGKLEKDQSYHKSCKTR